MALVQVSRKRLKILRRPLHFPAPALRLISRLRCHRLPHARPSHRSPNLRRLKPLDAKMEPDKPEAANRRNTGPARQIKSWRQQTLHRRTNLRPLRVQLNSRPRRLSRPTSRAAARRQGFWRESEAPCIVSRGCLLSVNGPHAELLVDWPIRARGQSANHGQENRGSRSAGYCRATARPGRRILHRCHGSLRPRARGKRHGLPEDARLLRCPIDKKPFWANSETQITR